jgi:hypothetical protein
MRGFWQRTVIRFGILAGLVLVNPRAAYLAPVTLDTWCSKRALQRSWGRGGRRLKRCKRSGIWLIQNA